MPVLREGLGKGSLAKRDGSACWVGYPPLPCPDIFQAIVEANSTRNVLEGGDNPAIVVTRLVALSSEQGVVDIATTTCMKRGRGDCREPHGVTAARWRRRRAGNGKFQSSNFQMHPAHSSSGLPKNRRPTRDGPGSCLVARAAIFDGAGRARSMRARMSRSLAHRRRSPRFPDQDAVSRRRRLRATRGGGNAFHRSRIFLVAFAFLDQDR